MRPAYTSFHDQIKLLNEIDNIFGQLTLIFIKIEIETGDN